MYTIQQLIDLLEDAKTMQGAEAIVTVPRWNATTAKTEHFEISHVLKPSVPVLGYSRLLLCISPEPLFSDE